MATYTITVNERTRKGKVLVALLYETGAISHRQTVTVEGKQYTVAVKKDYDSGWYCGQCEELPGALSQGRTIGKMLENMEEAIALVLDYEAEN